MVLRLMAPFCWERILFCLALMFRRSANNGID